MIAPTVGRVVWFWPASRSVQDRLDIDQPLAATIAFVHSNLSVNLTVHHQTGSTDAAADVYLWHGDTDRPSAGSFCEWMPYQKGQAAKVEQLEKTINQGYIDK